MRVNAREIRDVPEDELLDVLYGLVSWEEVQCIVVGDEIVANITFFPCLVECPKGIQPDVVFSTCAKKNIRV